MIISVLSVCSLANVYVVYSEIGARERAKKIGREVEEIAGVRRDRRMHGGAIFN